MKRRTLGFMLAAILLLSGGGMTISANAENRFLIPSSATEQEAIAKVKEYFGWENYSGTVDTTNLRFLYVYCDNEKKYFLLGKSQESKPKKLYDPVTFEDVFVYEGELTDGSYYYDNSEMNSQSHAWLRVEGLVVDITGDQFKNHEEFLYFNHPVYVGKPGKFHKLFRVEERNVHTFPGIDGYGDMTFNRLSKLYTIICQHI